MLSTQVLTSDEHDEYGETFLGVRVWRHVTESNTGEGSAREIEGGNVARTECGTSGFVVILGLDGGRQVVKPTDTRLQHGTLEITYRIPVTKTKYSVTNEITFNRYK